LEAQGLDSLHAGIDGLDKTGLLEGDAVGDFYSALVDDPIHDADVFGETAAGGLEASGASNSFVGGALGEGLMAAVVALAAGNVMEDYDAVAGSEAGDSGTDGCGYAGGFMAEDAGSGMRPGSDFLEIGAANAAGVNANQNLSGSDLRDGDGFEADVVYAAINRRPHGCGDRERPIV